LESFLKSEAIVSTVEDSVRLGESGWRDRYYGSKFTSDMPDPRKADLGSIRRQVRQSYTEGLVWVMRYYYRGCASWSWFYPFHFAPCACDMIGMRECVVDFELGEPFSPIEQLLAVQPASGRHMLPPEFHPLMAADSPISDFYPTSFKYDTDGKHLKWLWVPLINFVDENRLKDAVLKVVPAYRSLPSDAFGCDLLFVNARLASNPVGDPPMPGAAVPCDGPLNVALGEPVRSAFDNMGRVDENHVRIVPFATVRFRSPLLPSLSLFFAGSRVPFC
jgi:5'-3' exonuclease